LRFFEDEAGRVIDVDRLRFAAHRVREGRGGGDQLVADLHAPVAAVEVELKRDETRLQDRGKSRGDEFVRQSARLAAGDLQECVALLCVGPFVKEQADGAVAFVDRLGPMRGKREGEPIQRNAAVAPAVDPPGADTFAKTLRGWRGKFTGTSEVAVAGLQIIGLERPFYFAICAHDVLVRKRASKTVSERLTKTARN